jgi:hypothetical protein
MQYLGIDWGTRRASWCALDEHGAVGEGAIAADQDGLARLALTLGGDEEIRGCIEMMSGAVWVRDQLALVGWVEWTRLRGHFGACAVSRSPC